MSKGKGGKAKSAETLETQTAVTPLNSLDADIEKSDSTSIIEEKERKRQREQNDPETLVAITDAEKMLNIYRREIKPTVPAQRTCPENRVLDKNRASGDQAKFGIDEKVFYYKPMKDVKRMIHKNKSPEHSGAMAAKESKLSESYSVGGMYGYTNQAHVESENKRDASKTNPEPTKKLPAFLMETAPRRPSLLEQRPISEYLAPLKPLDRNSVLFQKQKVRCELENQGLLAPGTYEKAANEGIIGELEEAGLLKKGQKYTLSTGAPVRRPPPRVNQLPPLSKRPTALKDEISAVDFANFDISEGKGIDFDFFDHGRSLKFATAGDEKQQVQETSIETTTGSDKSVEITYTTQPICESNKLKLKLFALETL